MTLDEWRSRPDLVEAWSETWRLPHMQAGLQLLLRHVLPTRLDPPAGISPIEFNALQQARSAGYYDLLRIQDSMGVPSERAVELPEPWERPLNPPAED